MTRMTLRERLARMNQRSLFGPGRRRTATAAEVAGDPEDISTAGQARIEAIQRLQVGLFGIGAMVLLVGLASVIGAQASRNDALAVPEAAPTTEPSAEAPKPNPLADAGVVPDIAADPSPVSVPGSAPSSPLDEPGNAAPAP